VTSISKLFVKFMLQDQNVHDLNSVNGTHFGAFVEFLRFEIYVNYGKSSKDDDRTIAELRAVALEHDKSERGIGEDTFNRHLGNLGQVFRHAAARGARSLAEIDLSKFSAKGKKGRARDERPKLGLDQAMAIFQAPPFHNCAAWNALGEPGPEGAQQIFHCALYFVPMLIFYTGCRREELCGAMVNDVILDNGELPYIHIASNDQRRIKNIQSRRNVALHPEVLRLNFIEYVKAIKALGYDLLFPDLYSPSTRSPMVTGARARPASVIAKRTRSRYYANWS
jgi:integrase